MPHAHTNPFLHQNKPSRESIFCGKADTWRPKRALIMLNFWQKNRQKTISLHINVWQRNGKCVRLRLAMQAVAGHVAHGQRKQHYGKAEVRWNWQPVFCLWKTALNNYCLVCFLRNNHFWTKANGAENQISSYLSTALRTWATCFSWFYSTNIIQPFQIKGQYNSSAVAPRLRLIIQPFQIKGQYNFDISEEHFCYYTPSPAPVCIKISPILQHTFS